MKIVRYILNSYEKKEKTTIVLRTSIISPCLQYQIIRKDKKEGKIQNKIVHRHKCNYIIKKYIPRMS